MSNIFVSANLIQSAHDWIQYAVRECAHVPEILYELEKLLKDNADKVQIPVAKSVLESTLSWIHYERRANGQDRPSVETDIRKILVTVNRKEN